MTCTVMEDWKGGPLQLLSQGLLRCELLSTTANRASTLEYPCRLLGSKSPGTVFHRVQAVSNV